MINRKGQNTVEYILLAATIIFVLIVFLRRQGPMENSLRKTLNIMDTSIRSLNAEYGFNGVAGVPIHAK